MTSSFQIIKIYFTEKIIKKKSSQKKKKWPNGGRFINICRAPIFLVKINAVQNELLEAIIVFIFFGNKKN